MSTTLSGGSAAGPGGTVRWTLRGPDLLREAGAFRRQWQQVILRQLAPVAQRLLSGAQAAYRGTRFERTFVVSRTTVPAARISLAQPHPLFAVVEYPTRAHVIRPRRAGGRLVFQVGGQWVFAREVHHPGTKGRHAIDPLFARLEPEFRAALTAAVGEVLRGA